MRREYDLIADEYYDRERHPAIACLHEGARIGIHRALSTLKLTTVLRALEVGCGHPIVNQVDDLRNASLVGLDLSPAMLGNADLSCMLGDAEAMPCGSSSFDLLVASLSDPFNTPQFYSEARRVLSPGGSLVFAVPDYEWVRFNQRRGGIGEDSAAIRREDGSIVIVRSLVFAQRQQEEMLQRAGFAQTAVQSVSFSDLTPRCKIPPRFLDDSGELISQNIITVYSSQRPNPA